METKHQKRILFNDLHTKYLLSGHSSCYFFLNFANQLPHQSSGASTLCRYQETGEGAVSVESMGMNQASCCHQIAMSLSLLARTINWVSLSPDFPPWNTELHHPFALHLKTRV